MKTITKDIGNRTIAEFMPIRIKPKFQEYNYSYQYWTPNGIIKEDIFFGVLSKDDPKFENLILQCIVPKLKYDESWDWLIPVVEKIGAMMIDRYPINVTISTSGIYIGYNRSRPSGEEKDGKLEIINTLNINYFINNDKDKYSMIKSVWIGVVEFIDWYNKKMNHDK